VSVDVNSAVAYFRCVFIQQGNKGTTLAFANVTYISMINVGLMATRRGVFDVVSIAIIQTVHDREVPLRCEHTINFTAAANKDV